MPSVVYSITEGWRTPQVPVLMPFRILMMHECVVLNLLFSMRCLPTPTSGESSNCSLHQSVVNDICEGS